MAYNGSKDYPSTLPESGYANYKDLNAHWANEVTTTAPKNVTAIDAANEAMMLAKKLSDRVEAFAERLCGVIPMDGQSQTGSPQTSGILPSLHVASSEAMEFIRRAHRALDRIESSL